MIARTIVKTALKKLVIVSSGQEPSDEQYAEGLEILNDMIGSWSGNVSMIYEETREHLVVPSGVQSFTVGLSGDIITSRPIQIVQHNLMEGGSVPEPIIGWTGSSFCGGELPSNVGLAVGGLTREYTLAKADVVEFNQYLNKYTVNRPDRLYYQNTYPNGTFYFNSTTDQIYTIILNSYKELSEFPDLDTEVHLPKYYEKALKDNLAIELSPQMCSANRISPLMLRSAEESKDVIIGRAVKLNTLTTELSFGSRYSPDQGDANYGC